MMLALCVSFCACGGEKTIEDACEKADELVAQWNTEKANSCSFRSEYDAGSRLYIVYARYSASVNSMDATQAAFTKNRIAEGLRDEQSVKLEKLFADFDVSVSFILSDANGKNTHCWIVDGEIIGY